MESCAHSAAKLFIGSW